MTAAGACSSHHIGANGSMRHLRNDIARERLRVERIQILSKRLSLPGDALAERIAGNVLDPFHELNQEVVLIRLHRCEPNPAVAYDHGGHAIQRRGWGMGIPAGLTIVVAVDVDPARRDQQARSVERVPP